LEVSSQDIANNWITPSVAVLKVNVNNPTVTSLNLELIARNQAIEVSVFSVFLKTKLL
jgi:hypothetical protein